MTRQLLAVYGLKWNPFSPEIPDDALWRPAEVDVSIRPGWFYHAAEDEQVRTVDNLTDLYFSSVGRNGKLLLNVPPTRAGLLRPSVTSTLEAPLTTWALVRM